MPLQRQRSGAHEVTPVIGSSDFINHTLKQSLNIDLDLYS